jgi:hypothetical protein
MLAEKLIHAGTWAPSGGLNVALWLDRSGARN